MRQMDTMKRKQFVKGITQIAQEGAIQIFQEYKTGMEEIIVGVVGVLQFDVLKFRLEHEYNVDIRLEALPYEHIRWIENKDIDLGSSERHLGYEKDPRLKGQSAASVCEFLERGNDPGPQRGAGALGVRAELILRREKDAGRGEACSSKNKGKRFPDRPVPG